MQVHTHTLIPDKWDCIIIDSIKRFFGDEQGAAYGGGMGSQRRWWGRYRMIPAIPPPTTTSSMSVTIRHFIQKSEVTFGDEWCSEMLVVNPVDECDVFRKCRAGITRGCYRDLTGRMSACTALCKDTACDTDRTSVIESSPGRMDASLLFCCFVEIKNEGKRILTDKDETFVFIRLCLWTFKEDRITTGIGRNDKYESSTHY